MACFTVPAVVALVTTALRKKIPEEYRINILNVMLWGGVLALIVEHIAHGEVVPYPPFFTAGFNEMLPEIISIGIPMTLAVIALWGIIVFVPRALPQTVRSKSATT